MADGHDGDDDDGDDGIKETVYLLRVFQKRVCACSSGFAVCFFLHTPALNPSQSLVVVGRPVFEMRKKNWCRLRLFSMVVVVSGPCAVGAYFCLPSPPERAGMFCLPSVRCAVGAVFHLALLAEGLFAS